MRFNLFNILLFVKLSRKIIIYSNNKETKFYKYIQYKRIDKYRRIPRKIEAISKGDVSVAFAGN